MIHIYSNLFQLQETETLTKKKLIEKEILWLVKSKARLEQVQLEQTQGLKRYHQNPVFPHLQGPT